jgi:hypothetical protein
VGITVSASSAGGDKIYVAVGGIITGVTCQTQMGVGTQVCNGGTTAGRIGSCSSTTTDMITLGRMITSCNAGGTGTMQLWLR